jgi:small-conductance mechanosensitive channel
MRQVFSARTVCVWLSLVATFTLAAAAQAQILPEPQTGDPAESAMPPSVIAADDAEMPTDAEIQTRLQSIFANLPDLAAVAVEVDDGVVFLRGNVANSDAVDKAGDLAARVQGAVLVVNEIQRDRSVVSRMQSSMRELRSEFRDLAAQAPLLLLAAAIVGLAFFVARLAGRSEWLLQRVPTNWILQDLARQLLQLAIVFAGLLAALSLLDATALLGSVVGALGLLGLAVGFATKDTVENYIASILLSIRQPFRHDEFVRIDEVEGKVIRLTSRATVLMSLDGNHVRLPNAKVYKATIVNFSRNPLRRFEFTVGVDTELDLQEPRQLALETLKVLPGVLDNPPPACLVDALGDSNVVLRVQAWIDQRDSDFQKTRSEAQRLIKEAFDDAGVVMPEPIYNINLRRPQNKSPRDATPLHPPSAPVSVAEIVDEADTRVDSGVDAQIEADRRAQADKDLLDRNAPRE